MIRVRIYTENMNYQHVMDLACQHFNGCFNVTNMRGYWQGKAENSLVVEVLSDSPDIDTWTQAFCFDVKRDNKQECCLVTRETVDAFTV